MILQVDAYDPSETDDRPRPTYVSSKDWRILLAAIVVLAAILSPIYSYWRRQAWQHQCTQNFQQIQSALNVYLASNNDRYPPAFVTNEVNEPLLIDTGTGTKAPYTWISLIQGGMEKRASFECPAAGEDEAAFSLHAESGKTTIRSNYGLYLPRAGWPSSMIQDPDDAIIIAETSNGGSAETFNPLPFKEGPDGFVIGWNDSNTEMTSKSTHVTRLAFRETKDGKFDKLKARHDAGINVLFCTGRRDLIAPSSAEITRLGAGGRAVGFWADL